MAERSKPTALPVQYRSVAFDLGAARAALTADANAAIPLAISSEYPVERYYGIEILDHSNGAVDRTYIDRGDRSGLPLLMDHNVRQVVGRVIGITLGDDKVLRGAATFSKGPEGQAARQDIIDGIRPDISVGYVVKEFTAQERGGKDAADQYRATRWMPLEVSSVAVPADPTVGINRAADGNAADQHPITIRSEVQMAEVTPAAPTAPAVAAVAVAVGADHEAARVRDLTNLAEKANRKGDLDGWVSSGLTVADAVQRVMAGMRAVQPVVSTAANPDALPKLTGQERERYSIARAIHNAAHGTRGFESEVSDEIARVSGRSHAPGGVFVLPGVTRALDSVTVAGAKELVFTEFGGEFIEFLRNNAITAKMGVRMLPGLTSNVAFPKQTAAATAQWTGDNPGSAVTASQITTALVTLSPKQLMAQSSFSRMLLAQSSVAVDGVVRDDLSQVHALAVDLAVTQGTGASNQPTGIISTAGVTTVALGANGALAAYADITNLEKVVANANAMLRSPAYLTNPTQRNKFKNLAKLSNTISQAVWEGVGGTEENGWRGEMNGYPAYATTQLPATLTKGTATTCSAIIFGAWSQVLIGMWGALELIPDVVTQAGKGLILVTSIQMVDIKIRHPEAFAAILDAL